MKYKPGDPVWAKANVGPASFQLKKGIVCAGHEYPAVVLSKDEEEDFYRVEVFSIISFAKDGAWLIREKYLRPRRDDYQQYEPLGSSSDLDMLLKRYEPEIQGKRPDYIVVDDPLIRQK